jgi:hypothetical protein
MAWIAMSAVMALAGTAQAQTCSPGEVKVIGGAVPTFAQTPTGRGEPMLVALRMLLPADQGWKVDNSRRVPSTRVNYDAQDGWSGALSSVLRQSIACAELDVATRTLTLSDARPVAVAPKPALAAAPVEAVQAKPLPEPERKPEPQEPALAVKPVSAAPPPVEHPAPAPVAVVVAPVAPAAPAPEPVAPVAPAAPAPEPVAPVAPAPVAELVFEDADPYIPAQAPISNAPSRVTPLEVDVADRAGRYLAATLTDDDLDLIDDIGREWRLTPGLTLRQNLERWAEDSGFHIVWRADIDYPIDAGITFPATWTFREALRETMRSFWRQPKPLVATVYRNNVVVITARGRP